MIGSFFDFGKDYLNDRISVNFKDGVLNIQIPNVVVKDAGVYNSTIKTISEEIGIEIPSIDFSNHVNESGVLPDDYDYRLESEMKTSEEEIVNENEDKPGVKEK